MAKRPIFVPKTSGKIFVARVPVEFTWYAGMSIIQKQKSIRSLHDAAGNSRGIHRILEISSKSESALGVNLSAFNLKLEGPNSVPTPVEALFQGSKVFSRGGPYVDLYAKTPKEAKRDERLVKSGRLTAFCYAGFDWPLTPETAFYDWLYLSALKQNPNLADELFQFDGFTDIEFNPSKSINCQAASAALHVSLTRRQLLEAALASPEEFLRILAGQSAVSSTPQASLF